MRSQPSQDYAKATPIAADAQPATPAATPAPDQAASPTSAFVDQAVERGKKWINDSGLGTAINQLPQNIRDLSTKAKDGINGLSTTQKIVGGAILAVGLGWLASRNRAKKQADSGISRFTGSSRFGKGRFGNQDSRTAVGGSVGSPTHASSIDRGETHYPGAHYGSTSRASDVDGYRSDI